MDQQSGVAAGEGLRGGEEERCYKSSQQIEGVINRESRSQFIYYSISEFRLCGRDAG